MTGGTSGKDLEGLRSIYYNPQVYGVLPYRHTYNKTGEHLFSGFFLPAYSMISVEGYMDERGYTDPIKGKLFFEKRRQQKLADPGALLSEIAEFCFDAEEGFQLEGDNKFNKVNIADLLALIRVLKKQPNIEAGFLEYMYRNGEHTNENVCGFRWIPNQNGKVRILEHPIWGDGNKINGLYVIGIDGIDIGNNQTSQLTRDPSDFCLVVKKRVYGLQAPQYVAIYKDRPNDIREAYLISIKLALYYNAIINIEATRLSIIPWARDKKYLNYFMRRPKSTLSDAIRNTNKLYGTPATKAIIDHQTDLIADFINDYCYTIWFEDMLDLLNRYSDENKTKFDIIAAIAMAELADEELSGVIPRLTNRVEDTWEDFGYYYDDSGYKHWGKIPKKNDMFLGNTITTSDYDRIGIRTSDSRVYLRDL